MSLCAHSPEQREARADVTRLRSVVPAHQEFVSVWLPLNTAVHLLGGAVELNKVIAKNSEVALKCLILISSVKLCGPRPNPANSYLCLS